MKSISDVFRLSETYDLGSLANQADGLPATQKATSEADAAGVSTQYDARRVPKIELESIYLTDPVTRNSIDTITRLIMSTGYKMFYPVNKIGGIDYKDWYESFFEEVGERGSETTWSSILHKIFQYQFIYGDCWIEKIHREADIEQPIVDIDFLDPKFMDYARDSRRRVAVDSNGQPLGYVQYVPQGYQIKQIDPIPDGVNLSGQGNRIFLSPDRIVHYGLDSIGSGFYPIGLIEPAYKVIRYKLAYIEVLMESSIKLGQPILMLLAGDSTHDPNPAQLKYYRDMADNVKNRTTLALPWYVRPQLLEAKSITTGLDMLHYLDDLTVTSMGLPKAFAMQLGGDINRATLGRQEYVFKEKLLGYINSTVDLTHHKLFADIAESNGLDGYPEIRWNALSLDELDTKATRIAQYITSGILQPTPALSQYVRDVEDLP